MLPFSAAADTPSDRTRYVATVTEVIDGDTIKTEVDIWPGIVGSYSIRIRGIDAPEIRLDECQEAKDWGLEARDKASELYPIGRKIELRNVEPDAFAGRFIADVYRWRSDRWLSFADEMIDRYMAVPWNPSRDDVPWCLLAQTRE
jgi:endonuclease YncB( thermonuclease family)